MSKKMYIIELKLEGGFAIQYELGCISLRYVLLLG